MDGRNSLAAQANHEATTDQVQDSAGLEDLEPVSPLSEVLTSPSLPALPPQGEIPASQIPAALPPEEYAGASPTTAAPPPGGEVVPTTAAPTPALPPHQGSVGAPTTPAARPPSSDDGGKVAASWIRLTHWWLEIGANICSLGIAIATIVLLRKYDGTPVASWTFGLSLNTIVAILAGVSSAMLAFSVSECIGQQKWNWIRTRPMSLQSFEIFDEASRGPWGATRLLWSLRAK